MISWLGVTSAEADTEQSVSVWAGHQATFGKRRVPFKGEVTTRTDSYMIARLRRRGDIFELEQTACRMEFAKLGGATIDIDVESLPTTHMFFAAGEESERLTGRSLVSWSNEDIDGDGNPGMTIRVDAPVCSGELYVSNRSITEAKASFRPERLSGRGTVDVRQEILGSKGACLGAVAKNTSEQNEVAFAYTPAAADATCESLARGPWPVVRGKS
ncbi:MAG: hypothetical protein AAF799_38785 [Myxococcota bacterium]